ncbi:MAG: hypothetical protein AAGA75_23820 [Cyanobacteria bacterium P01_E01_bin.6]
MASSDLLVLNTIQEGLNVRTVDVLRKLLALLPIREKLTRKADLVKAIAAYLLGSGLKKLWNDLDTLQQAAVAEAVYLTDGHYYPEQFQAKYSSYPDWSSRSSSYIYGYNKPAAKLDLFFHPTGTYSQSVLMPQDLQAKLKAFVPKPKTFTIKSTTEIPQTVQVAYHRIDYKNRRKVTVTEDVSVRYCPTEQLAQRDLVAVLRLIHLGKVSVSDKTFMPSKATLTAIAPLLQGGDYYSDADEPDDTYHDPIGEIKPFAWVMLLQAGGLASLVGKKLQLTKAGQKAMTDAAATTIKAVWKKWMKTTLLDELRRVDNIKGQTGKGKRGLTAVSGRRSQIVQGLLLCPVGEWVTVDDLKRYMIANNETFEVSRYPENLYILESGYGNLYNAGGRWSILQDTYMKCLLFEYAATLGLVDIAYMPPYDVPRDDFNDLWGTDDLSFLSRYDGLLSFRINSLGAFCLGLDAAYTAAPITTDSTLRVLPNLDIVMTGAPLGPAERLMMDTFTTQTSDAVWKLDRKVALKAAEAGHSLKEFLDFLTQASAEALPKTVQQFFKDCRDRSASLQDKGVARLIECTDATLAALIANDSRTKKYCQLAGDKHLVVPLEQETRFRNGLRKVGYTLPMAKG